MSIHIKPFGVKEGRQAHLFVLANSMMTLEVSDYRAMITRLLVPNRNNQLIDIVLGYDHMSDYLADCDTCLGMIVGRFVNRIANSQFDLDGQCYHLSRNHGDHCLHSGFSGINEAIWHAKTLTTPTEQQLILHYESVDGEQGFPGHLNIDIIYALANDSCRFSITSRATTTKPTYVNLTNHSYFNLQGAGQSTILDHQLFINADYYTPTTKEQIPTGEIKSVSDTPFDFTTTKLMGSAMDQPHPDLIIGGGYDHNYVLKHDNDLPQASLMSSTTGIRLNLYTTKPGLQLYSGNHMPSSMRGKNGLIYPRRGGVCLEAQYFPDSMHHPQFPSPRLDPSEIYYHRSDYHFDIVD